VVANSLRDQRNRSSRFVQTDSWSRGESVSRFYAFNISSIYGNVLKFLLDSLRNLLNNSIREIILRVLVRPSVY
jgi:hypothetical protein